MCWINRVSLRTTGLKQLSAQHQSHSLLLHSEGKLNSSTDSKSQNVLKAEVGLFGVLITKDLLREGEEWFHMVHIANIRKLTVESEGGKKANCEGVARKHWWNSWNVRVHISSVQGRPPGTDEPKCSGIVLRSLSTHTPISVHRLCSQQTLFSNKDTYEELQVC